MFKLIANLLNRRKLLEPSFITSGNFICFRDDYSLSNVETIRYVAHGKNGHYHIYCEHVSDTRSAAGAAHNRIGPDNGISFNLEAAIRKLFKLERDTLKNGWIQEHSSHEINPTAGVSVIAERFGIEDPDAYVANYRSPEITRMIGELTLAAPQI